MNEEHSQAKNRAALVSLLAACLLTAIKLVVGIYTNSLGILSEALHSGLDLLAAAMTLYAVRLSSRPADARHPYGHGKVENLSALGETVLLFVICIWVVYEGAGRLLSGDTPVAPSIWGIIVMGISIVIDVNRVRVLKKSRQGDTEPGTGSRRPAFFDRHPVFCCRPRGGGGRLAGRQAAAA